MYVGLYALVSGMLVSMCLVVVLELGLGTNRLEGLGLVFGRCSYVDALPI